MRQSPLILSLFLFSTVSLADQEVANGLYGGLFATGSTLGNLTLVTNKPQSLNRTNTAMSVNNNNPYGDVYAALGTLNSNFGGGGGANVGFRYNCFRLEGEFLYNVNTANKMTYVNYENGQGVGDLTFNSSKSIANQHQQTYLQGQTNEYMGFINLFYDFLPAPSSSSSLYPYLGIGFGYQKISTVTKYVAQNWTATDSTTSVANEQWIVYGPAANQTPTSTSYPNCPPNNPDCNQYFASTGTSFNGSSFVAQGIVGLGYEMDSYFNFYLDFRYLTTPKINAYNTDIPYTTPPRTTGGKSFQIYTFNLGMNYALTNS